MSNDSHLFHTESSEERLPLYEAKMFFQFDHRYTTYEGATEANLNAGILPQTSEEQKKLPDFNILPYYWISKEEVKQRSQWKYNYFIAFRGIGRAMNERTFIFSILPFAAVGNSAPLFILNFDKSLYITCLLANLNSFVFDYIGRQKVGGTNLNFFIVKQLPVLPPTSYTETDISFISPRVLELVYTAYDLKPFAEDMGYQGEPFIWNEDRRAILRAELDAYYAYLYGLTRDELRYILDPSDVYGPDFPGETFRVLKEKEMKKYGEYRTRRLVFEAWDCLNHDFQD